jgi:hypothetical protein
MNVTLCPVVMETVLGLTEPLAPIVMVAPLAPAPLPDGVVGDPPPPSLLSLQAIVSASTAATPRFRYLLDMWLVMRVRRTFVKC